MRLCLYIPKISPHTQSQSHTSCRTAELPRTLLFFSEFIFTEFSLVASSNVSKSLIHKHGGGGGLGPPMVLGNHETIQPGIQK